MNLLRVLAMSVATISAARADSACMKVENDLDRLACYDKESGRTPTIRTTPSVKGSWKVEVETSKLTDDTNIYMVVASKEEVRCMFGSKPVYLVIRCVENRTSLMFATDCHMASSEYNDSGHITYRLDDVQATKVEAKESTDNKALGLWDGRRSIPMIKSMFGKKQMIARMRPYSESPFTVTFDIGGIEDEIAPLRKACGW